MNSRLESKQTRIILWILLFLSVCVMIACGYEKARILRIYRAGDDSYRQLSGHVRRTPETSAEPEAERWAAGRDINFSALQAVSSDAAAWLFSPDTVIDYPVMRADNLSYYLYHLPNGTLNANGSLFIDYNGAPDFSDSLTVIYGHNMRNGKMLGSITGYKQQAYFEAHPFMYLYTGQANYRIDLMYGCVIEAAQWRERAFMYRENLDALLAYAGRNTTFISSVRYEKGDRVVVLSTCSDEYNNARYLVMGLLRPGHAV